jgi:hypothetical protein
MAIWKPDCLPQSANKSPTSVRIDGERGSPMAKRGRPTRTASDRDADEDLGH